MSRFVSVVTIVVVVLLALGFAAVNAGYRTTMSLGFITLYRVPVTFVAFSGLFVGMLVMFATGIHSDLKVRRILRERLAEESRSEQARIDGSQQDLFHAEDGGGEPAEESAPAEAVRVDSPADPEAESERRIPPHPAGIEGGATKTDE